MVLAQQTGCSVPELELLNLKQLFETAFMNKSIVFHFPLTRPHCGVPLANGNFGVLVWGKDTLNITVNQNDLWDHRCGELIDERNSYVQLTEYAEKHNFDPTLSKQFHRTQPDFCRPRRLAAGRFEFAFSDGVQPVSAELSYTSGRLTVTLNNNRELTLVLVLKQNILYLEDPGQTIKKINLCPASDFPQIRDGNQRRGVAPYQRLSDGWQVVLPDDPGMTFRAVKTAYGYKIFTDNDGDDSRKAEQTAFTADWWNSFCSRTARVKTPDPWWNSFYDYNIYKLGTATCPFGKAGGLQGPWHEEYQEPQWAGDFHFNVNVQMIHGPLIQLGVPEHVLPLFDMIESPAFQESMQHNARALFKVDDALWQTHAVDDRGRQCGGIGCGAVLDPACGAWMALLYYDYFRYTGDMDFLRNRAWPYIYGIMRGYEEMLQNFNIPLAISAEYASSNKNMNTVAGRNPSYQLAAIRKLAMILIELAEVLKQKERPIWRQILKHVPHFSVVSGYDSYSGKTEKRIAIWEGQDLAVCHRHHSHLGCIWPFDSLPEHPDTETEEILANSIDHWISMGIGQWSEWAIPWANIIYTRMGLAEAPMQLFNIWREIFVNEGLTTVYRPRMLSLTNLRRKEIGKPEETSEIMQLDGCGGFLDAFTQMCAYTRFDKLHLFRGMPEKWQNISIENLLLPGGGRLSADRAEKTFEIRGGSREFIPDWHTPQMQ